MNPRHGEDAQRARRFLAATDKNDTPAHQQFRAQAAIACALLALVDAVAGVGDAVARRK